MLKQGKRISGLDRRSRKQRYSVEVAVKLVKANAKAKFDESIEIAVNLGVDPRHADQHGPRRLSRCPRAPAVTSASPSSPRTPRPRKPSPPAPTSWAPRSWSKSHPGRLRWTLTASFATPDMMALVGRLGKVLGPRGLMPNPRVGTVTPNVGHRRQGRQGRFAIEFRVEKAGIVHAGIGKVSFTEEALLANVRALVDALNKAKSVGRQGHLREAYRPVRRPWVRASRSTPARSARKRRTIVARQPDGRARKGPPVSRLGVSSAAPRSPRQRAVRWP
jgi:large subunit ribosomal protein L1